MCQIDQREGTVSFAAIRRVLRELFAKNHGGPSDPPPLQVRGVKNSERSFCQAPVRLGLSKGKRSYMHIITGFRFPITSALSFICDFHPIVDAWDVEKY